MDTTALVEQLTPLVERLSRLEEQVASLTSKVGTTRPAPTASNSGAAKKRRVVPEDPAVAEARKKIKDAIQHDGDATGEKFAKFEFTTCGGALRVLKNYVEDEAVKSVKEIEDSGESVTGRKMFERLCARHPTVFDDQSKFITRSGFARAAIHLGQEPVKLVAEKAGVSVKEAEQYFSGILSVYYNNRWSRRKWVKDLPKRVVQKRKQAKDADAAAEAPASSSSDAAADADASVEQVESNSALQPTPPVLPELTVSTSAEESTSAPAAKKTTRGKQS